MSEMIERMAAASYEVGMRPGCYEDLDESGKDIMRKRMRAVLHAMMQPTEDMIDPVSDAWGDPLGPTEWCWKNMIEMALH